MNTVSIRTLATFAALALSLVFVPFSGFAAESSTTPTASEKGAKPGKTHEHHAPHKGTLVECGEEFSHLELVLDDTSGKLTGYALDGEAENPVRLAQPTINLALAIPGNPTTVTVELKAVANPLSGETVGDTSEFTANVDALKGHNKFSGSVAEILIKGTEFKDVAFRFPEGNE